MAVSRQTSLMELRTIPGVGPKIAENLWKIGVRSVADLRGRDPEAVYAALVEREDRPVDRCALYVLRCAIYYASHKKHDPEKLKWWNWRDRF